jgi:SulP family sulfate permease
VGSRGVDTQTALGIDVVACVQNFSPIPSAVASARGITNIVAGFFQGMPVDGGLSSTAINVSAGAKTRWANILAGHIALVLELVFAGLIEQVAMPCVAALLIVAVPMAIIV